MILYQSGNWQKTFSVRLKLSIPVAGILGGMASSISIKEASSPPSPPFPSVSVLNH